MNSPPDGWYLRQELPALKTDDIVDGDAIAIGELYERSNLSFADAFTARIECGERLTEKKAALLHGEFGPWVKNNAGALGFSTDRTARRLMKLAAANRTLTSDLDDAAMLKISRQIWGNEPFVTANTGKIEWYTPPHLLERARAVLGGIDLDPASSAIANENVQAERYFTAEDDALSQEWPIGRIWMNPPYSSSLIKPFCTRFAAEMGRGSTGIVLVNNATETGWFNELVGCASTLCFVHGRVRYLDVDGDEVNAPLQGQAIIYSGPDSSAFRERFGDTGFVVRPLP